MLSRRSLLASGLLAAMGCWWGRRATPATSDRLALLVGVTDYAPGLPWKPLKGPANDVDLWARILTSRFGFPGSAITRLTSATTPPTRENIRTAFAALAEKAQPGGQAFILLSGHGSEQPDQVPPDPDDPEPNGMDQVFLPCDAEAPDLKRKVIPNGIIDDELRVWIRDVSAAGARVWLVFDCCHAGTMLRSDEDDGVRGVPAEKVWPPEVLKEARTNGQAAFRGQAATSFLKARSEKNVVALYACGPNESTIEAFFPALDAPDRVKLGVFTHALCSILGRADGPAPCLDLLRQATALYEGGPASRSRATPFGEGEDLTIPFLGEPPTRLPFVLTRHQEGWTVDGGQLHGLRTGAVLAVEGGGRARIASAGLTESQAEAIEGTWRSGARAKLSEVAVEAQAVAVHVGEVSMREGVMRRIKALSFVRLVPRHPDAWSLISRRGALVLQGPGDPGPCLPLSGGLDGLEAGLRRVAQVTSLLWATAEGQGPGLGLEMKLHRVAGKAGPLGPELAPGERLRFGDWAQAVIHNRGARAADVTVLGIDHKLNMACFLPDPGVEAPNRVQPGGTVQTPPLEMTPDEPGGGPEVLRLVLVAVEAGERPVDFSWLAADTLDLSRGRGLPPLGQVLAGAVFHQRPRSLASGGYQLGVRSWVAAP